MGNLISENHRHLIKSLLVLLSCVLILSSNLPALPKVEANGVVLSAYASSPPTIDGSVDLGEWSNADIVNLGTFGPGGIYSGTLYMMNNDTNLFVAVVTDGDADYSDDDGFYIVFDNDDGGETYHEQGDDQVRFCKDIGFMDIHYDSTSTNWYEDTVKGGVEDGSAAGSRQGSENHFELTHPLNSSDDSYDFNLSAGDTVGFNFILAVDGPQYWFESEGLGTPGNPSTYPDYIVHQPILSASVIDIPVIDGTKDGPWDDADFAGFFINGHAGKIYVMNGYDELYILVTIEDDDPTGDNLRINFDNDAGGSSLSVGDDSIGMWSTFDDRFYDGTNISPDTSDSGSSDGQGAVGISGTTLTYEFRHPLNSTDDSHDFSLSFGDTVGFTITYWDGSTASYWPAYWNDPDNFGEIIVAPGRFVGMLNFDDYANRMGSLTPMERRTQFYFPHFHQDSNWQTYYTIVNPSPATIFTINVVYYASDGTEILTDSFSLGPRQKTGRFPPTGTGWIRVQSSGGAVGMLNFDDYANRMGSMPGTVESEILYFPHFHRDSSWQTFYALVNPGTSSANIDVTYYASDGTTIDTESFSLGPKQKTGKFPPNGIGWIKVVSSQPIVGMLNFDDYANRMGSMPGVEPSTTLYFPHFHRDSSWQTFYALVNPQSTGASIDVTYYANDGSPLSTDSFSLDAGHKTGKFPASGSGWIKVVSNQPIVGMLNFDDYANRMGSMPGVTPLFDLYFQHFDQSSNWQTYYAIVNLESDCDFTVWYYAPDGSTITTTLTSLGMRSKSGSFPPSVSGWRRN